MVEQVKAITGHDIVTFQGAYGGERFTIDGKVGLHPEQSDVSDKTSAKPVDAPDSSKLTPDQFSDPIAVEKFVRKSFQLDMDAKRKRIAEVEEELVRIKAKYAKREASAEALIQERIAAHLSPKLALESKDVSTKPAEMEVSDPTGKGWRLWQNQDWDEALRMFEIAVKREPESGPAWNGLGWTYLHLGRSELAKSAFEKALLTEPKNLGARNGLGRILMAIGKLDDAEKELLRATQEVIDEYGEEQSISREITAPWFGLVEVLLKKKDFAGATNWAERYLKHDPDQAQMLQFLKNAQDGTRL